MSKKRAVFIVFAFALALPFVLVKFMHWQSVAAASPTLSAHTQQIGVVVDSTASMGPELQALAQAWQANPPQTVAAIEGTTAVNCHEYPCGPLTATLRLVQFRDNAQFMGTTTDYNTFGTNLLNLEAAGGDTCPDSALLGLLTMGKNWGDQRTPTNDILLMTDATPFGNRANYAFVINQMQRRGISVHALVSGWCSGAPISELALQYLTLATGGRYYSPTSASELYTTTLMAQTRLFDTDLLASALGSVTGGTPDMIPLEVDSTLNGISIEATTLGWTTCLTCTRQPAATYPNAVDRTAIAGLQIDLIDPNNNFYDASSPYLLRLTTTDKEMWVLRPPLTATLTAGTWHVRVSGSGDYGLSIGGQSETNMMYLGPTNLPVNRQTLVRVLLGTQHNNSFVPPKTVTYAFQPVNPNTAGASWPVTLFDDGQHNDGAAGDGIYAGMVQPPEAGWWRLSATGELLDGSKFQRMAEVPVRTQSFRLEASTPQVGKAGQTQTVDFILTNDSESETSFELGMFSEQGWTVTNTIPSLVTLQANETITLTTNVVVPPATASGLLEESTLVAVAVNDDSLILTAVAEIQILNERIFLPAVIR